MQNLWDGLLAEVQRRRLFSDHQCSSLFDYCVNHLGYSEGPAYRRIIAMRLVEEIPEMEEKISQGSLSLSNVAQAQKFFNQEGKQRQEKFTLKQKKDVLKQLENKSTRQGEKQLLGMSQNPKVHRERVRVVSDQDTELRIIANQDLMAKLERIKGLLAHKNPAALHSYAELLDVICDVALKELQPKEPSQKDYKNSDKLVSLSTSQVTEQHRSKRKAQSKVQSRKVGQSSEVGQRKTQRKALSRAVKRVVWKRDKGECVQCGSQHALQYDHIQPVSFGGKDHPDNILLKCRPCNQRAAIKKLGLEKMESYIKR